MPVLPITGLGPAAVEEQSYDVAVAPQSKEEADVNGTETRHRYRSHGWRNPLLLYLDGITDEGNLGAILRSCYVLGVDGVIMSGRRNAPMSAITTKAASGAAEALQLFNAEKPREFFQNSSVAGWQIYAASMPPSSNPSSPNITFTRNQGQSETVPDAPLSRNPVILVLGNEETGVSSHILARAHYHVGVTAAREPGEIGLDSLNVSVATALLCMRFLKTPNQNLKLKQDDNLLF